VSFLLDTNVISEPRRKRPDLRVMSWFGSTDRGSLHISVLTLGELTMGAARLARRDGVQAAVLRQWLDDTRQRYTNRIIPIDSEISEAWGELNAIRPLPVIDGLLAATALVRGMTFVTRDTRDIAGTGARTINPWIA
jgi:predicted nucleic acid-binding protein